MKDTSIVLTGEAGQGIQTVEHILTRVLKLSGYHVFATKEYMSRIRGGCNSTEIRVSSRRVSAFCDRIDLLIPLSAGSTGHLRRRVSPETVILGEEENLEAWKAVPDQGTVEIPLSRMAGEIGGKMYANVIAAGVVSGLFGLDIQVLAEYLKERFAGKDEGIIGKNLTAAGEGYSIGGRLRESGKVAVEAGTDPSVGEEVLLNGAEAVGLGAIAGGCNFISSYPMSPSTGVLVFMAGQAGDFGIIAEQAEDEISAVNMALGASYAGARVMVTTSGGGLALMTEGISLAGMLEQPLVVHLAQRPGPATGLPTRTEQGDLNLALYAGHGEFPRIILAPGRIEEAFSLTRRAFDLTDRYQVPVFILTDQYFMDSYCNLPSFDLSEIGVERHIVETDEGYQRYRLTENGVSPRGVPGFGRGLVAVDSDEHDQEGHITEDLDLRVRMVAKRMKKLELLEAHAVPPTLVGPEDHRVLVVGWGSTFHPVREALEELGRDDLAFLHFGQVYPLPAEGAGYLERAGKRVIIENNATSQFGQLIRLETGLDFHERILKYNGLPFSVEEVREKLENLD
jgi:2-oxoglutarate ferredoxin oxidoreductase subunit alpha